jgi:predicted GTPase
MASIRTVSRLQLEDHSNIVIQGCSGSGKSELCARILQSDDIFVTPPSLIIFCYKTWQRIYTTLEQNLSNIIFLPSLPTESELKNMVGGEKSE